MNVHSSGEKAMAKVKKKLKGQTLRSRSFDQKSWYGIMEGLTCTTRNTNRRLRIKRSYLKKYNFSGEPKNIFKGSLSNEFVIFQNVVTPGVRTIKP